MGCTVHYLNSAGIHLREIKGIDALAAALPSSWLLYASLACYPKNSSPLDIDALLVTDERILLLELKDWHGELTSCGGRWLVNENPRGRSPVDLLAEKARKVKGIIAQRIPALARAYVDFRVVLTGSATAAKLDPDEQRYTWTLTQATALADPAQRRRLLEQKTLPRTRPNTLIAEFDRLLRNPNLFRASQMKWDGYGIGESDLFVHPTGLWREHGVQQFRDPRIKALLRRWSLDKLPHALNSPETRRLVAEREARAFGLLREAGSRLVADGAVLQPVSAPPDEVLTDHYEILALPPNWTTLRRYVEKNRAAFTADQRLDAVSALLGTVAELHAHGVAHRDLAPGCVWIGSPTRLALTGFMSAQIPADESVANWLAVLRGYSPALPEDLDANLRGTAKERDVHQLGAIAQELLVTEAAGAEFGSLTVGIDAVLAKALARVPGDRYPDARAFADAFGLVLSPPEPTIDQSRLDAFEVADIPFVRWPLASMIAQDGLTTVYATSNNRVVKVWTATRRGASQAVDLAMLTMFEGVGRLRARPVEGLPLFEAAGLSPVGPFVIYAHAPGQPLPEVEVGTPVSAAAVIEKAAAAVAALHDLGCAHGDLSPGNILVTDQGGAASVTIIDLFDLAPTGAGTVRNLAFAPEGWERLTAMQIDRYAVARIAREMLDRLGEADLPALSRAVEEDLARPAIESLESLIAAARQDLARLNAPPIPHFVVRAPGLPAAVIAPDEGRLYVRIRRSRDDRTEYRIAGVDRAVLLRMRGHLIEHCAIEALAFDDLAAGRRGAPVAMTLEIGNGRVEDVAELVAFLKRTFPGCPEPDDAAGDDPGFEVADLWRSLIDLEENLVPTVTIGERLADTADAAVFEYQSDRPFDFDSESEVEVRSLDGGRGRPLGKLDLRDLTDRTLAVRALSRPLSRGDTVVLVDRRAQASIDRRRRGLDRILAGQSEIPDLIDFFEPRRDKAPAAYDLAPTDADLAGYALNAGQRDAFRDVLAQGPVGLLQGPPGTGKTRFIGALVHWLVSEGGARKILVASQSHEAVNGAAEELIKLFGARGDRLELLRVGAKGLTSRLQPYHSSTLRERYQRRFEGGLKGRLAAAGGALGVSRALLYDLVDLDRDCGAVARRMELLQDAFDAPDLTPEESRRLRERLRAAEAAFARAAPAWLGQEIDGATGAYSLLEEAYRRLLDRHDRSTPADLATGRRLLALSREWSETLRAGHRNFEEFLAKTRTVIAGTCVGLGQTRIRLEAGSFDWVIVDEAARCTAGELAVPLQLGRRVLLVGDHLQLPPMIDREMVKAVADDHPEIPRREVGRSDFERAFTSSYGRAVGRTLDEQYRMVEPICRLVSKIFYVPHGVKLVTSDDREPDDRFTAELPPLLARPITWIDTKGARAAHEHKPKASEHSTWNEAEVDAIMRLLRHIAEQRELAAALAADDEQAIGVICMYKRQKQEIERRFAQQPFDDAFRRAVKIDTVDSYQGKENAIVIVSLVRANSAFDAGHVGRPHRCNVALSRARERLYIVGNSEMWGDRRCTSPMRAVLREIRDRRDGSAAVVGSDTVR